MPAANEIPSLVKHVALAIMAKNPSPFRKRNSLIPKGVSLQSESFLQSYIMAVNELVRQGHLGMGSSANPDGRITLTGSGMKLNQQHRTEGGGKDAQFDKLYEAAMTERASPPGERVEAVSPEEREALRHRPKLASAPRRAVGSALKTSPKKEVLQKERQDKKKGSSVQTKIKKGISRAKHAIVKPKPKPKGRV